MRPVGRRAMLLGLTGLPLLASCGLELTRPKLSEDPTRKADPAALRQGGVLRWPLDMFPVNFNYNQADMTGYTAAVIGALMPSSHTSDPHGKIRVNTDYFTAIELREDARQTVVYTINPKAHWSDGSPITWEDLKAQWQAQSGNNPDYQVSSTTGYRDIAAVERGTDDRQAVVSFQRNYADWRSLFSYLYPKSTNDDTAAFNKGWILNLSGFAQTPITAGPFKIGSSDAGQKRLTVVADPHWWGGAPRLDSIVFLELAPDAQIGALQNDEIDFASLGSSAPNLAIAENTRSLDIRTGPNQFLGNLTFNGKPGGVCADMRLRRAVAMGVDRERLVSTLLGAVVAKPEASYNLVFIKGSEGYEDHRAALPYDPEAAAAELDRLGWTQRGPFRAKEGRQLSLRLVIPAQSPSSTNNAKILQQMLAEIGVELVIVPVAVNGFFRDYINAGNFDLTLFSWGHTPYPTDIGSIFGLYPKADGTLDTQQNYGQIGSPEINDLIARMQQELDVEKMLRIGNQIDVKIAEIVHSMSLSQAPANIAARSELRNFGPVGIGDVDYTAIGYIH
ncbi:extracellular solute-binding protein family 5 [Segniliparus rotundus DSM 44985]|uniref:Extracellular solute-binding protein family 5 n=1 Tax=Segniliparus rotundus (strain ATCC BAA-972 / CDC 1076 / CIP 108378 / DSM 44985 / JCM 13578) TaxID=640132 RepID=D6ZEZ5_SEGRD|nr:ABC transporter family substrate-binding protein [Segniliparus rotundus]ADG97519.1 extracellular solute-binding protein family 5 [Segniliparus rotundus DSM 44985]